MWAMQLLYEIFARKVIAFVQEIIKISLIKRSLILCERQMNFPENLKVTIEIITIGCNIKQFAPRKNFQKMPETSGRSWSADV